MAEETQEETTQQNPEEEETPEEENPQSEPEEAPKETPQEEETSEKTEKSEEYTDREKRYYERMKASDESAKKAREEAKKAREELSQLKKGSDFSDVDTILEIQTATKGLSPEEVSELKNRASIDGVPLSEARKNENYILWQTAYRAKVAKEKETLTPSSKQTESKKPQTLVERLGVSELRKGEKKISVSDLRKEMAEKEKVLREEGLYDEPGDIKQERVRMDNYKAA
jgi:hypothetical protein